MKYTEDVIVDILLKDNRNIVLKPGTFVSMTTPAIFIDPMFGEWAATPKRVLLRKTNHPTRANIARKNSNISARIDGSVNQKTKSTNLSRYGVEVASKNADVKEQARNTCIDKFGGPSSMCSKEVRDKSCAAKQDRYGDKYYRNKEKTKQTNLVKYGYTNPMSNPSVIQKGIKTKESTGLITRPRGKNWQDLASELGIPRTSLQEFVRNNPDEKAIENFISFRESNYSDIESAFSTLMSNAPKLVGQVCNYRPDFKINDLYINVDGLYWHSQKIDRDKKYHYKLREAFESEGKRILQFRADDIKYRSSIVKSMVDNISGNTVNKIFARKCSIESVSADEARTFLSNNHMMGKSNSQFIGLMHGGKLVSLVGFKVKNRVLDIDRFASLIGHNVVGGLSRLISHVEKKLKGQIDMIHYWVDLRYGTGKSLTNAGFTYKRDIQGWQWTDFNKTYHRSKCKASNGVSQNENAAKIGLWQIYDAGQRLFTKELK